MWEILGELFQTVSVGFLALRLAASKDRRSTLRWFSPQTLAGLAILPLFRLPRIKVLLISIRQIKSARIHQQLF